MSTEPEHDWDRAQRMFDQAVERERLASQLHERAAAMHEAAAERFDEAVSTQRQQAQRDVFRDQAKAERQLAAVAHDRARVARQRLIDEGVAVTSEGHEQLDSGARKDHTS